MLVHILCGSAPLVLDESAGKFSCASRSVRMQHVYTTKLMLLPYDENYSRVNGLTETHNQEADRCPGRPVLELVDQMVKYLDVSGSR